MSSLSRVSALIGVTTFLLEFNAFSNTAPMELNTAPADSVVVFNEVQYHPASDDPKEEWIELYNQMTVDVDLSHWTLTGGIHYEFPAGTVLTTGSYLVVAADPGTMKSKTGVENAWGPWTGKINNAGDTITLRNHNGRLMDQLEFLDAPPWPIGADGSGVTLAKVRRNTPSGPASNWQNSSRTGGTPGKVNFPELEGAALVVRPLFGYDQPGRVLGPSAQDASALWLTPAFVDTAWSATSSSFGFDTTDTFPSDPQAPQRYYPLDASWNDASGNGFDAIPSGPAFSTNTPPVLNHAKAADFQGVNQFAQIPDPIDPAQYTLTAWVRFETVRACSIVVRTDASGPTTRWSHQLRLAAGGKFEHYVNDGSTNIITGTNIISRGQWYHVAISAEGNGSMKLYVNGVQDGTTRSLKTLWTGGDRWRLGSNSGDGKGFMDGQIADLAIWHRVLTDNELATLATGQPPLLLHGLRGNFITDIANLPRPSHSLWLRTPFEVSPDFQYDQLTLQIRYADGFVAWLNGEEIARRNAPNTLSWDSAATSAKSDADALRLESIDVGAHLSALKPGANVLAVQLLSAIGSDSNGILAVQLQGRERLAQMPLAIHEISSFSEAAPWVELYNYSDTDLALGGIQLKTSRGAVQTLPTVTLPAKGFYVVDAKALNPSGADGLRLYLFGSSGSLYLDSALWTSRLQGRTEDHPLREWMRPDAPTPGSANRFVVHDEIVINEIMYHAPPHYGTAGELPVTTNTLLLPFDSVWHYSNPTNEIDPTWKDVTFDDSTWGSGPGALGLATGTLPVPIQTPVTSSGRWTYYFRTSFDFSGTTRPFDLLLTSMVDDGAVFYLNGQEVQRINMPTGAIKSTTKATASIASINLSPTVKLSTNALILGHNVLAVEVHQANTNNPVDFVLAARVHIAEILEPGTPGEAFETDKEQWVELYNRSQHAVDLSGWRLVGGANYIFPARTSLAPDAYVVVSNDRSALAQKFPGIAILGDFTGKMQHGTDHIRLLDANGNPANEVHYYGGRPWPEAGDAGGSSIELKDPRADNSIPEAWAASDETQRSPWQHYEFRTTAIEPNYKPGPYGFTELRLCLMDSGEALIDNVSVLEDPGFTPRELIQNRTFDSGLTKWRVTGNHIHTFSDIDPDHAGNKVMHLVATGAGSYLQNIVETSFKSGSSFVNITAGREYSISFDAKWISGTPLLRAEFYYNKLARTLRLTQPTQHGTPGARNSRYTPNLGPTYQLLTQQPVAPRFKQPIHLSVQATDPDGVDALKLFYSVGGKPWAQIPMQSVQGSEFAADIPAQTNNVLIQFYIQGTDLKHAVSLYPPGGTNSRALIRVDNAPPTPKVPLIRALTLPKEATGFMDMTNLLSDDAVECTFVMGDQEVIFGGGIRLHGSMFSRQTPDNNGFAIKFPADHPYKGVRDSLIFRRRDFGEVVARHMLANASQVPGNYDEFVYFISPIQGNAGIARVLFGNDDEIWLKSIYNGNSAQVFKMEGIREFQAASPAGTEGYKLAMPIGWIQEYDLKDQGDDKEQYRWTTLIANHRDEDNYSGFIPFSKALGLSGTNLQSVVPQVMDVEEWSKIFALQSLCGVADVYTVENPHNLGFLVRPTDGRVLALQNDWSFYFQRDTSASLIGIQNVSKVFSLPIYKRVLYGNALDLMNTTFNRTYIDRWLQHYGDITGENYSSIGDYVRTRAQAVTNQFPKPFPFVITSNQGQDFTTNQPVVTLRGRGWIDVRKVALGTDLTPISVQWLDFTNWQTVVALMPGTNDLLFTALDRSDKTVGTASIRIISTETDRPQLDALRISEIMFHPPAPSANELAAGFTDGDEFEFVEIVNRGTLPVSLRGVQFTAGIQFTFDGSSPVQLEPEQRTLVVRNLEAFQLRYGTGLLVAGTYSGSLNNGGELLRLSDASGTTIDEVRYGDSGDWPARADGNGSSLERLLYTGSGSDAKAWQASLNTGGSPGSANEVLPSLEVHSTASSDVDLLLVIPSGSGFQLEFREDLELGAWKAIQVLDGSTTPRSQRLQITTASNSKSGYYRLHQP